MPRNRNVVAAVPRECNVVAAVLAEPLQGVGGVITPPKEFFETLVGIVRRHGGIFICDEMQGGFWRTGTHFASIQHYGVKPENMTFAKAIANGMPMGATEGRSEVDDAIARLDRAFASVKS